MTLLNTTQLEAAVSKIDSTIDEAVVILKDDTKSAQERINAATATLERENTDLGDAIASVNPTVPGGAIGPGGAIDTDAPADAPVGGGDNVSTQPAGDASAVGDATPGTGGEAAPNQ